MLLRFQVLYTNIKDDQLRHIYHFSYLHTIVLSVNMVGFGLWLRGCLKVTIGSF